MFCQCVSVFFILESVAEFFNVSEIVAVLWK